MVYTVVMLLSPSRIQGNNIQQQALGLSEVNK